MVMNGYLFPKEKCCRTTKMAKHIQRSHVINLGCLKHSSNPPISMGGLMTYHQDGVRDLGSNMFSSVFPFAIGTAAKESWSRLFRPLDCLDNGSCFQLIVFRMGEHHVQKYLIRQKWKEGPHTCFCEFYIIEFEIPNYSYYLPMRVLQCFHGLPFHDLLRVMSFCGRSSKSVAPHAVMIRLLGPQQPM